MLKSKHAILITAYKSPTQLEMLLGQFNEGYFNIYIHIDKKSCLKFEPKHLANIKIIRDFNVNYGSFNHLKAILKLTEIAIQDQENLMFHLITGEDLLLSQNRLIELDANFNYLESFRLPSSCWNNNGGLDRYSYFHLTDFIDIKRYSLANRLNSKLISIQKKMGFCRKLQIFPSFYGGSTYWSLNRRATEYVIKNSTPLLKRVRNTYCPEEIFFQTILLNADEDFKLVNKNLRYIDWKNSENGSPNYLDEDKLFELKESEYIFARKVKLEVMTKFKVQFN
jgi:hypothetical protein